MMSELALRPHPAPEKVVLINGWILHQHSLPIGAGMKRWGNTQTGTDRETGVMDWKFETGASLELFRARDATFLDKLGRSSMLLLSASLCWACQRSGHCWPGPMGALSAYVNSGGLTAKVQSVKTHLSSLSAT